MKLFPQATGKYKGIKHTHTHHATCQASHVQAFVTYK